MTPREFADCTPDKSCWHHPTTSSRAGILLTPCENGASSLLLCEAGVHDVNDSVDSDGSLGDVSRHDNFPAIEIETWPATCAAEADLNRKSCREVSLRTAFRNTNGFDPSNETDTCQRNPWPAGRASREAWPRGRLKDPLLLQRWKGGVEGHRHLSQGFSRCLFYAGGLLWHCL